MKVSGIQGARLLAALQGGQPQEGKKRKGDGPAFRLATIPPGYVSGRPTLIFDGETEAGARPYPKLTGLTLAPGDRVLVAMVGTGGVVIGVIE